MSHYDEEFEKQILEASINIRNEHKDENIHIRTGGDYDNYVAKANALKSDYIIGDVTEEELLEGLDEYTAHANLVSDPWHHLFMGEGVDDDFGDILDEIRNSKKPRASFKNGEWVLK